MSIVFLNAQMIIRIGHPKTRKQCQTTVTECLDGTLRKPGRHVLWGARNTWRTVILTEKLTHGLPKKA